MTRQKGTLSILRFFGKRWTTLYIYLLSFYADLFHVPQIPQIPQPSFLPVQPVFACQAVFCY